MRPGRNEDHTAILNRASSMYGTLQESGQGVGAGRFIGMDADGSYRTYSRGLAAPTPCPDLQLLWFSIVFTTFFEHIIQVQTSSHNHRHRYWIKPLLHRRILLYLRQ